MRKVSSGNFNSGANAPAQCTAMSKRSQEKCKGVAVTGTNPPRCRMHGGTTDIGTKSLGYKGVGRYSKYLPTDLEGAYEDSIVNPDILEMAENIGLLETRIKSILLELQAGEPMPRWNQIAEMFGPVETALISGDTDRFMKALDDFHKFLDNGRRWDRAWDEILGTMDQLRKVADTEVKRRKELHQMVPIERVMVLMGAMATAVKRHVHDTDTCNKIIRELAMLQGNDPPGKERVPLSDPIPTKGPLTRRRALAANIIDAEIS